jgi:hypothetical protein
MAFNIDSYRKRLEEYEERLNRRLYQYYSGRRSNLDLVSLYSDYSDIFSLDSIHEVETESKNTSEMFESRRKSLNKIHNYLKEQHLDIALATLTEEIADLENQRAIVWEGRDLAMVQISQRLKNEPDAFKRRKLSEHHARELQNSEALRLESLSRLQLAAGRLGFKNYSHARAQIDGVEFDKMLDSLDAALRPLEDKYMERLKNSIELTHSFPESGVWDAAYWQNKNEAEPVFSKDKLLSIAETTFAEMGVQPERPECIELDFENREGKSASPACIPIRIPHEIKILMLPENGAGSYASLFHEIGHAYHFAWTNPSLPMEHRIIGDCAVSEAYAFLFESFLLDSQWLASMFSFIKSSAFLRFQALFRLFQIRRCAGKLRYAVALYEKDRFEGMPEYYADTMKSYTGLTHLPEYWIYDLASGFYASHHLRGWMLEAMLREYLRTKFGNSWIISRSAAGFLKEIWETGQLYRAEDLCREIGMGDLNPQVLADEISEGLKI